MTDHDAAKPTGDATDRPGTAVTATRTARGGPFAWRAVDLVTLAVLGVAFGVAFWGFNNVLYPPLKVALQAFPPASASLIGVWLLPAVFGALLVRRPGAALLIELVAANVSMLLGNEWGPTVMISGALQGLGVEIVVALYRWRRWRPDTAIAAGAMAAICEVVLYEWWVYVVEYSTAWKLAYLTFSVASGAVIAGLGAWALTRALATAGALTAFPPGEERLTADLEDDQDDPAPTGPDGRPGQG
ncbi:energy-coupling factor transport system substrate-specific component [Austwickia chelonae]|uniref:Putative ABC transporter permease protein n=1 Tax=Austwickia chelonae NBRC 105200 TaxID=1184607 RepID=K6W9B9_9MICO|nr:ECF transporter S component [Austwickia chelonae]GAB78447.1 putative ABC transporter permease protein [Austwickia chelonae NBRC 105200]SEW39650.1 energy-coupling factor transport system substrate-specific component [Austwickia chelonae]